MKKYILSLIYLCPIALFSDTIIESFRLNFDKIQTRMVWEINKPGNIVVSKTKPKTIVIKFENANTKTPLFQPETHPLIEKMYTILGKDKSVKVILTLKKEAQYNEFFLKPYKKTGHRFVLDLTETSESISVSEQTKTSTRQKVPAKEYVSQVSKKFLVVIDPGHGGKDPGAIGQFGTKEKDITLSVSKKLAKLIRKDPNMHVLMVRTDDSFVELPKRISHANSSRANLFLSIHADSAPNLQAAGSSVFILSEKGAIEEARRILNLKNSGIELAGGYGQNNLLSSLTLNFRIANTTKTSEKIAEKIIDKLRDFTKPVNSKVRHSEFTVLRSLEVPAVLIETDFISNSEREKLLNTNWYQKKIAKAIFDGIKDYLALNE